MAGWARSERRRGAWHDAQGTRRRAPKGPAATTASRNSARATSIAARGRSPLSAGGLNAAAVVSVAAESDAASSNGHARVVRAGSSSERIWRMQHRRHMSWLHELLQRMSCVLSKHIGQSGGADVRGAALRNGVIAATAANSAQVKVEWLTSSVKFHKALQPEQNRTPQLLQLSARGPGDTTGFKLVQTGHGTTTEAISNGSVIVHVSIS